MISGKTKIIGIFGDPIEHTLSPLIHNRAFSYLGIDYCYVPFNVKKDKIREAIESIKVLNIRGVNITVPHKEAVIQYIDELSDEAKEIGAVNTILNHDGRLKGFNTDAKGFVLSLQDEGILIKDKNFLILGAGGAAKALVYGILNQDGRVYIYNRTISKALEIKQKFSRFGFIEIVKIDKSVLEKIDIIVNATSLGLNIDDPMPLNPELIKPEHIYCDIVYPETPLMRQASKIGCKVVGGIGMLIWQAALAFKIWTDIEAPIDVMRRCLNEVLTKN